MITAKVEWQPRIRKGVTLTLSEQTYRQLIGMLRSHARVGGVDSACAEQLYTEILNAVGHAEQGEFQ